MSVHNIADRQRKTARKKLNPIQFHLPYFDDVEYEEFGDIANPRNLAGRRPRNDEWGDYIAEEQDWYISAIMSGEINRDAG